jgi:hypothetical protein
MRTMDFRRADVTMNLPRIGSAALVVALALSLLPCLGAPPRNDEPVNLALNKPAWASSIENDEHAASQANDGDAETRWCADDEPEGGPEWWMVDLQKPADLSGCQVRWPYDGMKYRYKVEGSADRKKWSLLNDQSNTTLVAQVHDLKFMDAKAIRYVKITVTGLDDGCWASICEVKVFGSKRMMGTRR